MPRKIWWAAPHKTGPLKSATSVSSTPSAKRITANSWFDRWSWEAVFLPVFREAEVFFWVWDLRPEDLAVLLVPLFLLELFLLRAFAIGVYTSFLPGGMLMGRFNVDVKINFCGIEG